MIFVDTSAWYAAYVPSDPRHAEVQPLVDHPRLPLVTTDWVLAESLTLLRVRGEDMRAIARGRALLSQGCAKLLRVEPVDLERAFKVFEGFADKRKFRGHGAVGNRRRARSGSAFSSDARRRHGAEPALA